MSPGAPRRGWAIACGLVLVAGVLFLHHEVLVGGMVYHLEDAADGYYPSHVATARALSEGALPTWERGAWCGWPLANDPYYGVFYPPSVLFHLIGAVRGLGWTVALHAILGALGMFWLLRRRKLDLGPALLGAVSLAFSTFMVVRIRHVIFPQAMGWLPLILCGIEGFLTTRRRRELMLAAGATGMALLCGALPLAPYLVMVVGAYALPRVYRSDGPRLPAFGWLALAGVIGGLIACAQMVPTVAHIPYSPRALGVDYAFASSYAWPDPRYLGTLLLPNVFGTEDRGNWFGAFNHWEMAGYYAGAWVVLLMPFGLARAKKRPELWGLAVAAIVGILLAFGDHGPLHGFFFRHVPLYSALRCPTRALILFLVAGPILAAEGLSWLCERDGRRARLAIAVAGALLLVAGLAVCAKMSLSKGIFPPGVMAARRSVAHLSAVLAAGGGVLVLLAVTRARAQAAAALALVTLVDLLAINRGYVQPKPADFAAGTERFAAVDWLIDQKPTDRFVPDPHGPFRLHNLGMTYGLQGASGYDSVTVWHYVNFLYTLNHGAPYPHRPLKDDLAAGDVKRYDTPLVDLLNVRWAIAQRAPAPDWIERFRPKSGDKPHARHEPVWDPQLAVFENPHVLPRAFVVYGAEVLEDDTAHARALARLDPRKTALLDRAPDPKPIGDGRPFTPATIVRAERHRLVIEAQPEAAGILVVSETDYPGWRVTVDGAPAQLLRADYAFRGVALTAGKHTVEMTFQSRPTRVGLLLSGLGLIALLALVLLGRRGRWASTVV